MPNIVITALGLVIFLLELIHVAESCDNLLAPPEAKTVLSGSNTSLTCEYTTDCASNYWTWNGSLITENDTNYSITNLTIFNRVKDTIAFTANLSVSGVYFCNITNNSNTEIRLAFRLNVEKVVEVTISPTDINGTEGDNASLTCEAVGSPRPTITWYRNGVSLLSPLHSTKYEGDHIIASRLLFRPLERGDGGDYRCTATNAPSLKGLTRANSLSAHVRVYYPPEFVLKPVSVTRGVAGGNVSLYCSVMANPLPPVVSWLIGNGINVTNSSTSDLVIPKIINSTLVLENLKLTDEQNYTCYVEQVIPSNNNRTIIETQTQLLIAYPPQLSSPIVNVTVNISDEITLSCQGFGNPRPVIEWYFTSQDGAEFQLYDASTSLPLNDTTIASYLTLTNLTLDQKGSYKCKGMNNVTNLIGATEEISIYLTVHSLPQVLRRNSSSNYTLLVNGSITLSFSVNSASPLVRNELISWTLTAVNGDIKALKSTDRLYISPDHLSLTISPLLLEDNGLIQVTVFNEVGTSYSNYYLFIGIVPDVTDTSRQVGVALGTRNISFTCSSSGYPTPVLTWYINDHDLIISRDKYSLLDLNNGTSVLTVFDISLSDAAQYTCFAGNVFGNDTVDNYLSVQVPPNVTLTPSQVTLSVSDSLQLVCSSYGLPVVSLVWYFGASRDPLESNESILNISQSITMHGPLLMTTSVLSIDSVTGRWEGMFTCEGFNNVTNLIRTSENDTTEVIIPIPPKVDIIGSNNVTAVLSQSLIIAVSLSESSPPVRLADIMWSFTNTSGYTGFITNSSSENYQFSSDYLILTISDISFSDEGNYKVTVSTTAGNDSALIAVDVEMQPLPMTSFLRVEVLVGHNASLPCEAASEPVHSIEWRVNDINVVTDNGTKYVNGMKYGELIITNTAPSDAGEYTCTISNIHGEANITVILDILVPPVLEYSSKSEVLFVGHSYDISVKIINKPNPPVNSSSIMLYSSRFLEAVIMYNESLRSVNIFFNNVTVNHSGTYQLTVENRAGKDTASITLDVEASPLIYSAGSSIVLKEGDSMTLLCTADGLPPPSLLWLANGRSFSSASNISTVPVDSVRKGVPTFSSRLSATDVLPTDNGSYVCMAENKWGTVTIQYNISVAPVYHSFCDSSPCNIGSSCLNEASGYLCLCSEGWTGRNCSIIATVESEPQFLDFMTIFYQEYESSVLLSCPVTGYPQPQIMWYKDEVLLEGIRTEEYEIKRLNLDTRGIYHCNATNELGSVKSDNIYVKIRGLVQYQANISFTEDYINDLINQGRRKRRQLEATKERLDRLISNVSTEMRKIFNLNESAEYNYISLEIASSAVIKSLLDNITVVLSLTSQSRGTDHLKSFVEYAFAQLRQNLRALSASSDPVRVGNIRRFDGCTPETTEIPSPNGDPNLSFVFAWPETDLSQQVTLRCPCGPEGFDIGIVRNATRRCNGNFEEGAEWESPVDTACNFSITARKLCSIAYIQDPVEVLTGLKNIISTTDDIGSLELSLAISLTDNQRTAIKGNKELTDSYLTIVDNLTSINYDIFAESNEESRASSRLLRSFEDVIENYPVNAGGATVLLKRQFVVVARGFKFSGNVSRNSILSVRYADSENNNHVSLTDDIVDPSARVLIPGSLLSNISSKGESTIRLIQAAFDTDVLFLRRKSLLRQWSQLKVGSILVLSSIANHTISRQENVITITLKKDKDLKKNASKSHCSFWDHASDDYYGNWSSYGCKVLNEDTDSVTCGCNHLTTFALLLDVSPTEESNRPPAFEKSVMSVTFTGCAVSTLCLTLIILTYSIEKHLRSTNNGKLLINMSCALIGLYVIFIPSSFAYSIEPLCVTLSALLHYFFLATFLSMASEATILYIELVKVFTRSKHGMIIKAVIVTWVTPLFIVAFTLAPNYKNYIYEEKFCRPVGFQFWIGYAGPFAIIYIYNWIMLLIIVASLFKQQCKIRSQGAGGTSGSNGRRLGTNFKKQVLLVITLSILFGIGWGIGLTATSTIPTEWMRYALEISFVIVVSIHGTLIFIFYGLRISKVRKTWLKWLYIITNQHMKAIKVDQTLRATYSFKRDTRLKQMYSLGTMNADTNVELKQYKLNVTPSTCQTNYCSSNSSTNTTVTVNTPSPEPVKEKDVGRITNSNVKNILEKQYTQKVVQFVEKVEKSDCREEEHQQLSNDAKYHQITNGHSLVQSDNNNANDSSKRYSERFSICSDLVPEPV